MSASDLKRRWSEPDRLRLVRDIRTWLTGQGPQPDGLEKHQGRTDLRGIPLTATPATIGDKDNPAAGITWDSLDLTGSQLEQLRFFAGTITNCVFDTANLNGLRLWGTRVTDSTFRRTDLRNSALGTGEWHGLRNTWQHVTLDRANLRDTTFTAAILNHCTFEKTSKLLQLPDCELEGCVFTGELNTLLIDGRGHRYPVDPSSFSADFTRAVFTDSSILGYRLDKVRLPEQQGLLVIHQWPTTLRAAVTWLRRDEATEPEQRLAKIYERMLTSPGENAANSDYCYDAKGYGDPALTEAAFRAIQHTTA